MSRSLITELMTDEFSARDRQNFERNVRQSRLKSFPKKPSPNELKEDDLGVYIDQATNSYVLILKKGNRLIEWFSNGTQEPVTVQHTVAAGDVLTIQNGLIIKIA